MNRVEERFILKLQALIDFLLRGQTTAAFIAMEQKRTLHFTSPGFRSQEIVIAPELDESTSKRRPWIEDEVREASTAFANVLRAHIYLFMLLGQSFRCADCGVGRRYQGQE